MVRLVESSQGIDDCFDEKPDLNVLYKCKDGLRNMHFKFDKTMKSFNKMNNDIQIISENMVLMAQFKKRIPSNNFAFNNDTVDVVESFEITSDIAEKSMESWIGSPGHNLNLLNKKATRFSYKIYRTKHKGYSYIHGVFLLANEKEKM
jgi:hypothetical protein